MSEPRKTWTTRDGRKLPVAEMSTDHLLNIVRMVLRQTPKEMLRMALAAASYASSAPDGAAMAAESESNWLFENSDNEREGLRFAKEHVSNFKPVVEELVKRLKEKP